MLARDYHELGSDKSILYRIGDGSGFPFKGPLKIRFLDAHTLAVIEIDKGISFLNINVNGYQSLARSPTKNSGMVAGKAHDIADTNDSDSVSFLKATATDICRVPLSKNISISDTTSKSISFVDATEWFHKKTMPGQYLGLVGVSCFSIGFEAFFCICDSIEKSVSITREGGQVICSSCGNPANSFEDPVSMSLWTAAADLSEAIPSPPWYVGECSMEDLRYKLPDEAEPGSFLVAKDSDIESPKTYNVVYIDSIWRREMATIAQTETGTYLLGSKDASLIQDSVWDIIKNWDMLIQPEYDPRKCVLIAVADTATKCVQILKYYWWKNHLYTPTIEYFCTIGGIFKECGLRFVRPNAVSFCNGPDGDLAICDAGAQKVHILSNRLIPVHVIETGYMPDWRVFSDADAGKAVRVDSLPVSVAFSPDRVLCVAFKQGGILVYKPYTVAPVGRMVDFESNIFEILLKYTDYQSIETLRNSCRRFHNITRDLRKRWKLPIMSQSRYQDVLFQYIKWARLDSGLPFIGSIGLLKDGNQKPLCLNQLNKTCTNQFCTDSHEALEIDLNKLYRKGESFLMYEHVQMAFTEVYGTPFLWKNGIFISKYFEQYSESKRYVTRQDPMTWKNETVRKEAVKDTSVLTFWRYLYLFTMAEECFTRCKLFGDQPEFRVFSRPSAAIPRDQFKTVKDSVLFDDVERAYVENIGKIPAVKNKVPHLKALTGLVEVQKKETNISAGNAHVKYFDMQADQAVNLMDRLFS